MLHKLAQRFGIPKRCEWPVDRAHDLAQKNLGRRPLEPVTTFGSADALNEARMLKLQQDRLQKFFRKLLVFGNFPDLDGALRVSTCEQHPSFQCVESFLGDPHM